MLKSKNSVWQRAGLCLVLCLSVLVLNDYLLVRWLAPPTIVTLDVGALSHRYALQLQQQSRTEVDVRASAQSFSHLLDAWLKHLQSQNMLVLAKPAVLGEREDITNKTWQVLSARLTQSSNHNLAGGA